MKMFEYMTTFLSREKCWVWDFPAGPRLRFHASNAGAEGSIPGQGTKIPHYVWHSQKKSAGLILSRKMRPSFASSPEVRPDFWNSGPRSGLGVPGSSSKDHLSISSARMAEARQLLPPTPF